MGCVFCATGQVTYSRYAWRRTGVILEHDWCILPVHGLLRALVHLRLIGYLPVHETVYVTPQIPFQPPSLISGYCREVKCSVNAALNSPVLN